MNVELYRGSDGAPWLKVTPERPWSLAEADRFVDTCWNGSWSAIERVVDANRLPVLRQAFTRWVQELDAADTELVVTIQLRVPCGR